MPDIPQTEFFVRGGVALLLGLSVGLERERSAHEDHHAHFAGIRTFPICALTGFLCALHDGTSMIVVGFAAVAALAVAAYFKASRSEHPGVTTEAAYLLTYLLGAGCARGLVLQSASVALVVTTLLAGREPLRRFAQTLPERDLAAALKFGLISLVILPLIPNRDVGGGWWAVNFYQTWLMVVLISGIGFAGYILTRLVGPRAGTGLAGFVGGLVSSTAVTLTFSKKSREAPTLSAACSLAILAACAMLWPRVLAEAFIRNPDFGFELLPIAGLLFGVSALFVAFAWRQASQGVPTGETSAVTYRNPVELLPAIKFAAIFAVVTIAFRYAQHGFGARGTHIAAFLSGLSDMDAVTLSMANMTKSGAIATAPAIGNVLLALTSNTLVKLGIVVFMGSAGTRRTTAIGLGATCIAAIAATAFALRG
ncbi:MAG: MgtC/SapB family protein [Planctomycetes bacterium]|nr:MgtC/SapB family protein [Planctomycetota bacterium]